MKKYAVYGVGNALVDTEFEVPDSFFTEQGIEKGCMTLVSKEQQQHLTNILTKEYDIKKKIWWRLCMQYFICSNSFWRESLLRM